MVPASKQRQQINSCIMQLKVSASAAKLNWEFWLTEWWDLWDPEVDLKWFHQAIRYDTIWYEFNVESKAECDQLNLAHETKTKNAVPLSSLHVHDLW